MNNHLFLPLASVAALLASCTPKTSPDIHAYGLKGDVREVRLSVLLINDEPGEENILVADEDLLMAFDEQGRVIQDDYGNKYTYDADGQYAGPYADFVEVVRDPKGRLLSYNNTGIREEDFEDFDVMSYCDLTREYDARGRVVTETYNGWEWGYTVNYVYENDHIWPAVMSTDGFVEGFHERIGNTFEYLDFDDRGNWTRRRVTSVNTSCEDGFEEEAETFTQTTIETRTITYWSAGK